MNTKKQFTFIVLGMIMILPILNTGCFKKGEDDPFVSMYTRKARMAGTWKFEEVSSVIQSEFGANESEITLTTTKSDRKTWYQKVQLVGTDSVREYKGFVDDPVNFIKFDKQGNFEQFFLYYYIVQKEIGEDGDVVRYRTTVSERIKGSWNFLGKVEKNDYKNKERIALMYQFRDYSERIDTTFIRAEEEGGIPVWTTKSNHEIRQSFKNGEESFVWVLKSLKNKEIVMEHDVYNKYISTYGTLSTTVSTTDSGTKKIKLKR